MVIANSVRQQEILDTYQETFPVKTPEAIQSHGFLLAINPNCFTIEKVSQNIFSYLGKTPKELLGQSLELLLSDRQISALTARLAKKSKLSFTHHFTFTIQSKKRCFQGLVYQTKQAIVLELESAEAESERNDWYFSDLLEDTLAQMQEVIYLHDWLSLVSDKIRHLTGFDRVMVYRFDQDGVGIVEAESKTEAICSYLGLHFPCIDIPGTARELFQQNPLRLIPDIDDEPVPLVAHKDSAEVLPLDMSCSLLRQTSPCHIQYLRNMGVTASMVMPLIKDQKLWGLITCHHRTPKSISHVIRKVCIFLGKVMCLELNNKVNSAILDAQQKQQVLLAEFIEAIAQADDLKTALVEPGQTLLPLVEAHGAAICLNGDITQIGLTPDLAEIEALLTWVIPQTENNLFYTGSLAEQYPPAENFQSSTSGILFLQISKVLQSSILWFRPEVTQTVEWAGDPGIQLDKNNDGSLKLGPRKSFEIWKEIVHHRSLPWRDCDLKIALELRSSLVGIVLNKADELAKLNLELQRSNQELDSFAYAASHDLQEPLRGIHNYAKLMIRDSPETLEERDVERLATIMKLTQRMQSLIEALLHFSRLGQVEIKRKPTNLNDTLGQVIKLLQMNRDDASIEFCVPRPLPTVNVEPIFITEVFSNLLSNALKYNTQSDKWVEIGYLTAEDTDFSSIAQQKNITDASIYYVKDNGIGIRDRHLTKIFRLFKRLHGRDKFGGGTGAGLTITRKIIECHGGLIWTESDYGKGSTFYFTLGASSETPLETT